MNITRKFITNKTHFDLQFTGRVSIGTTKYRNPGIYYFKNSYRRCARGCCDEEVVSCLTPRERFNELTEEIKKLVEERKEMLGDIIPSFKP